MRTLFKNIKELLQVREAGLDFVAGEAMNDLPTIQDAYLLVEDGLIKDFGTMTDCPKVEVDEVVDATGKMILPTWCDSHTHLVYAGNRESEFVDKIKGLSYHEIAAKGGGILNSAKKLQETSEDDLYEQTKIRLDEIIALGTGAVEIKSGYGLTEASELKMLRVIKRLKENYKLPIKATFLGAHAVPTEYKDDKAGYLNMLVEKLMPKIAEESLAEFVDIFCEEGYFSVEDTEFIMEAGKKLGLISKIHVNQFTSIGGVQAGVKHEALSVDHLEEMKDEDIEALKGSKTMPVALPGCSFFLSIPYTPGRKMIDAGLPLALATDYNPGSSPSGNMNFAVSAACIKMKLTPEEAINAATINGAYAMGLQDTVGSIAVGKEANLILTKPINSYNFIPYSFGENQIESVYIKGHSII
ncbi:imidazolonepropionase [Aestuariibaculum sp. M13]|uniref:imidazolonepropionase n=1 Tax=Aestuariibaculum sp. M13 TaxID=2967132 RepID=UPI002159EAA5|nr:imidazolonepropionase [Aestuariibaculum sp. M13]MCR8668624.1 imidazolonepropionase [Aestuariibaculum sp. M13]